MADLEEIWPQWPGDAGMTCEVTLDQKKPASAVRSKLGLDTGADKEKAEVVEEGPYGVPVPKATQAAKFRFQADRRLSFRTSRREALWFTPANQTRTHHAS